MNLCLVIEARRGNGWMFVSMLAPGMPPGSISDNTPTTRDVYLFGFDSKNPAGAPKLWRSPSGADAELLGGAARVVVPTDKLELVAELAEPGATYERQFFTDRGVRAHLRFKCIDADAT